MKQSLRTLCSAFTVSAMLLIVFSVAQAQVNAVYVESNDPTTNSVIGYSNDGNGNLTLLPGSPYSTGGTGWVVPTGQQLGFQGDDDGQIIANAAGTLLFAVNGHSNTIAAFTINSDASLSPAGAPIPSAGTQPASLSLFDNALAGGGSLLVVVNKSSDTSQTNSKTPNIASFTVSSAGIMTANVGSKVTFATGSSPAQAVTGNAKLVFIDEFMSSPSSIAAYRIRSNGHFQLTDSKPAPTGNVFLGEVLHPGQNVVYGSLPADNEIAVYTYSNSTGELTFVTTVATPGALACWLNINSTGTRMYAAETGSNSVSVYDITTPTAPVALQDITLASTGNGGPWNAHLDPTGKFLYVVTGTALHVLNVDGNGMLSEPLIPVNLPVASGTFPYGLVTLLK